jgi:hypothetical protein
VEEMAAVDFVTTCNYIREECRKCECDQKWHIGEHSILANPESRLVHVSISTGQVFYDNWRGFFNNMVQRAATSGVQFTYNIHILQEHLMMYERLDIMELDPWYSNRFNRPLGEEVVITPDLFKKATNRRFRCCCIL